MTHTLTAPTAPTMNHPTPNVSNVKHVSVPMAELEALAATPGSFLAATLPEWRKTLAATDGLIIHIAVTETCERYHDGDSTHITNVEAVVWHPVLGKATRKVLHWQPSTGSPTIRTPFSVNATPEVLEAYTKWYTEQFLPAAEAEYVKAQVSARTHKVECAIDEIRSTIRRGDVVTVARGRKYAKGLTGKVFWLGQDNYGNTKAGIATSDRRDVSGRNLDVAWVALANLDKTPTGGDAARIGELQAELALIGTKAFQDTLRGDIARKYSVVGSGMAHYWFAYTLDGRLAAGWASGEGCFEFKHFRV